MSRFHTAGIGLLSLWIGLFVVFTALQLRFNKTAFTVDGVVVCSVSDVIEFLIPVIIVPAYWLVWFRCETSKVDFRRLFPMLIGSLIFTHGHGVHLAANSLSNTCFARNGISSVAEGSTELAHFAQALDWFDELVSHWLWISGIVIFAISILYSQISALQLHGKVVRYEETSIFTKILCALYGTVYGVIFWAHNIEGGTVFLGLPLSVFIVAWLGKRRDSLLAVSPIAVLFLVSHVVTTLLLVGWFFMWGGFPEFSHLPKDQNNWIASWYKTSGEQKAINIEL